MEKFRCQSCHTWRAKSVRLYKLPAIEISQNYFSESYKRFITNLNKDFLPPFSAFVRLFTVLFVERGTHVEEEESAEALDEHVNGMLQQYVDTVR